MDERVYSVDVCPDCLTQRDSVGRSLSRCQNCDSTAHVVTVRFRVARSLVLKQADPRKSLVERTVYFGCVGQAGHYYWHRSREGHPYKQRHQGKSLGDEMAAASPWGSSIDGGLFGHGARPGVGKAHVFHKDDWTALAFEDPSVDSRPGSWSVYCTPAVLDGPEALALAREAFPTIFARYTFDVVLAT